MNRWQAIVFDLDDTLYPEHEYVLSGMRAVAVWAQDELGFPTQQTFDELRQLFEEGVRGDTFNRWLAGHGLEPDDRVAAMVDVYRRHRPQITSYPQVPQLLTRLGREYRLGLLSDGYLEVQQRKVAALDLERHFQAVVYSDAFGRDAWKPSPRPFQAILKHLCVAAHQAVYVADNPTKDFQGARRVGMHTIRVRHPDGLYRNLEPKSAQYAPDMEAAGLDQLLSVLDSYVVTFARRARMFSRRRYGGVPGVPPGAKRLWLRPKAALGESLDTEEVCCDLCGTSESRRLFTETYRLGESEAVLRIVRCKRCGLVYVSPRLTFESTQCVYRQDAERTISHNYCWRGNPDARRFRRLLRRLVRIRPGGRLLDVGCGDGDFLAEAKRVGKWDVVGVEPSASAAERARQRAKCTVHADTLEQTPLQPASFDVVAMFGVLEHLHHPMGTLQQVYELLKPSGILAVYVPSFHYLRIKDTGLPALFRRGRRSDLHPQEHLFHFTPRSLGALLEAANFELLNLDIGHPFMHGGLIKRGLKLAGYQGVRIVFALTGLHLGGLEAIARRSDKRNGSRDRQTVTT